MRKKGFSLIELLVVISVLAIMATIAIVSLSGNLGKSRDVKRKTDLARLKTAFEEYYDDKGAFPSSDILNTCGGSALSPYLGKIPCDPRTKRSYCYIYDQDSGGQNFRILSSLETDGDPVAEELNCDGDPDFCGFETECSELGLGNKYNYGVSSSNIYVSRAGIGSSQVEGATEESGSPQEAPAGSGPGDYSCTPQGTCNRYTLPGPLSPPNNCTYTFSTGEQGSPCEIYCQSPAAIRCAR